MFLAASPPIWRQSFAKPELADAREQSNTKENHELLHAHGPPLLGGGA
jgi:hypothetical protein